MPYDALLLAPGAHAVDGVPGTTTWHPGGDPAGYGGLLRDLEEGYASKLAIVVPAGATWPLPAYELALMTAGEAAAWAGPPRSSSSRPSPSRSRSSARRRRRPWRRSSPAPGSRCAPA